MNDKLYTVAELVSFGNYLLSEERTGDIDKSLREVNHADLMNWQDQENIKSIAPSINALIQKVEMCGASVELTDTVVFLGKAKDAIQKIGNK